MNIKFSSGQEQVSLNFTELSMQFGDAVYQNVFRCKNNKTVAQTVMHKRYRHLAAQVAESYSESTHLPIGIFLLQLKDRRDLFYKTFLNDCGDLEYCRFRIDSHKWRKKKGIYIYTHNNVRKYVGRCLNTFEKRFNAGYGSISPKNCFKDGQKTNCHLNNLVLTNKDSLRLFVYEMTDSEEIKLLERTLIRALNPEWNITLR